MGRDSKLSQKNIQNGVKKENFLKANFQANFPVKNLLRNIKKMQGNLLYLVSFVKFTKAFQKIRVIKYNTVLF